MLYDVLRQIQKEGGSVTFRPGEAWSRNAVPVVVARMEPNGTGTEAYRTIFLGEDDPEDHLAEELRAIWREVRTTRGAALAS